MKDKYIKERKKVLRRRIKELALERKGLLEDQRRCKVEINMLNQKDKT